MSQPPPAPPAPPVSYATPGLSERDHLRRQRIMERLKLGDSITAGLIAVWIAGGLLISLIGPFLLAMFFAIASLRFSRGFEGVGTRFLVVLVVSAAILIPLMMWYRRRTHGSYFANNPLTPAQSYSEYEYNRHRAAGVVFMEFALLGAELLWNAWDAINGHKDTRGADRELCVAAIEYLLQASQAMPVASLIRASPDPHGMVRVIKYLKQHEWVDISADGKRIWLLSARANSLK